MPSRQENAEHRRDQARDIAEGVASDLADLRTQAGATLDEVAREFGRNRAWMSKLETGRIQEVSLADYLMIVSFLQGMSADHPATALSRYLKGKGRRANPRLVREVEQ